MDLTSASYRDPAGSTVPHEGRGFRPINNQNADAIHEVLNHPTVIELRDKGSIVGYDFVLDRNDWPEGVPDKCKYVLEHELVEPISYPYEWSVVRLGSESSAD